MTSDKESQLSDHLLDWTADGAPPSTELKRHIDRNGFVIVRNVFTEPEIGKLRTILLRRLRKGGSRLALGRSLPNAAIAVPELEFLFTHSRAIELFKRLIDPEKTIFTGHCDIHMNTLSGWHKDSGEQYGGYFKGDFINDVQCRVYKMAIYLQDAGRRDGLTVRKGSHRYPGVSTGEVIQARTRMGDVVLFDVRLTHTGQLPDFVEKMIKATNLVLKGSRRTTQDHPLASALKSWYWKFIGRRDRLSVFFTCGFDNEHTANFARMNMDRQLLQGTSSNAGLSTATVSKLHRQGISVSSCAMRDGPGGA